MLRRLRHGRGDPGNRPGTGDRIQAGSVDGPHRVIMITPVIQKWIDDARRDPEGFWAAAARELPWLRQWDRVFEWTFPTFRWFLGAETNLAYIALDHHVSSGRGGHTALIYFNERGERRLFSYASLLHEVERVAASLRAIGIGKGDRLTIYMPTCPEAIVLMLATVRIGAIHSVVFAGFGARALADRIQASGSRLVFTADVTWRKGRNVRLKEIVDEALETADVERVVVLRRTDQPAPMRAGRDVAWDAFIAAAADQDSDCERMEA